METNKEKYIRFCEENDFVPIFSQPWWMDAVCVDGYWDVLLYEKNGEILGALPFYVKKRFGLSYITQPQLNAMTGLVIKYPSNQKFNKKISYENDVIEGLAKQVDGLGMHYFQQTLNCKYTNWLGFYWNGYRQRTSYNYSYTGLFGKSEEELLKSYATNKRQDIKTAHSNGLYLDKNTVSIEKFYEFHRACLKKLDKEISFSFQLIRNMIEESMKHNMGRLFVVRNDKLELAAISFVIWDKQAAYAINTAIDHSRSDAGALIYHEELKYFSQYVDTFYFSGSMLKGVEATYRRFSNEQTPCITVSKILSKNPFLKLLFRLKGM